MVLTNFDSESILLLIVDNSHFIRWWNRFINIVWCNVEFFKSNINLILKWVFYRYSHYVIINSFKVLNIISSSRKCNCPVTSVVKLIKGLQYISNLWYTRNLWQSRKYFKVRETIFYLNLLTVFAKKVLFLVVFYCMF